VPNLLVQARLWAEGAVELIEPAWSVAQRIHDAQGSAVRERLVALLFICVVVVGMNARAEPRRRVAAKGFDANRNFSQVLNQRPKLKQNKDHASVSVATDFGRVTS
jgi:hypothetical protein